MDLFGETISAREAYAAAALIEPHETDDPARRAAYERATNLVDTFDAYVAEITKAGSGGPSPLVEAAGTEFFEPPTERSEEDYLLYVDLSATGADAMTGYGLIKGSTAAFLGFTQAYYALVRRDGTVVASGSITEDVAARLHLDTAALELPAQGSKEAGRT